MIARPAAQAPDGADEVRAHRSHRRRLRLPPVPEGRRVAAARLPEYVIVEIDRGVPDVPIQVGATGLVLA